MTDEAAARVLEAVATRREAVNAALDDHLPPAEPERLYAASRHLLAGGKRLRPAVLLLVAESLADREDPPPYRAFPGLEGGTIDVLAAGVSIEIVHLFTLIHDDIMDDDDMRRGLPSVHRAYDTETAILAGDTLYSKAFEVMLDVGAPPDRLVRVLDRLASTCTRICEGQALDISFETADTVTTDEYHRMIELKTAVIYGAAASIPAVLLGAEERTSESLYRYGIEAGAAFQIHDDILDLTVPSDDLGKRRGSDLIEGKQTLITLHARQQGVDVDGLIENPAAASDATIDAAVERLEAAGSVEFARETARSLVDRAKGRLEVLPANDARDLLADLADYLVRRGH